jgi:hypothetical protein
MLRTSGVCSARSAARWRRLVMVSGFWLSMDRKRKYGRPPFSAQPIVTRLFWGVKGPWPETARAAGKNAGPPAVGKFPTIAAGKPEARLALACPCLLSMYQ